jgi:hypothetical protein
MHQQTFVQQLRYNEHAKEDHKKGEQLPCSTAEAIPFDEQKGEWWQPQKQHALISEAPGQHCQVFKKAIPAGSKDGAHGDPTWYPNHPLC